MTDESGDQLRHLFAASEERSAQADDVYRALKKTKRLSKQRSVTYLCGNGHRCRLLDVVQTPTGLLLHVPRYKLSPGVNEESSNESGRAANTEDGDRHWRGHSFYADEAADLLTLTCDHVRDTIAVADVIKDMQNGEREIRWPR